MTDQKTLDASGASLLSDGLGLKFSPLMMKIWGQDIRRAEGLVTGSIPSGGTDSGYVIELDPEDFLDLCAGKWHES